VTVHPADTTVGNGGSTSASRQTYVTAARSRPCARRCGRSCSSWRCPVGEPRSELTSADIVAVLGDDAIEETVEWRHRPTTALDPETGQGFAHVQYGFAAHRAVVDVDVELGLVKVSSWPAPRTWARR